MRRQLLTATASALGGGVLVAILALGGSDSASAADPTCSTTLGIANHGQHVIGDYITGVGRDNLDWPPSGGIVGEETSDGGPEFPGGPGPGFHFQQDPPFAPGASLCLSQPRSPGLHLGP